MKHSSKIQTWLRRLLMLTGAILIAATVPVFFPVNWMATIHGWLGLEAFPEEPIVIYLARSTSLLYAVHGVVIMTIGFKMEKYLDLVPMIGLLHIAIGLTMFGIDLTAPMPWWWSAGEGLPVAILGGVILWMHSRCK